MAGKPGRSGGRRQGTPGVKYTNRSDMRKGPTQAARAAPGQEYGKATQQLNSQRQMPLANAPQAAPGGPSPSAAPGGAGGGGPQVVPSLTAPSTRPNEPLTAGLATGAGPGPEALNLGAGDSEDSQIIASLRGMYQAFPSSDLAALIAEMDARG